MEKQNFYMMSEDDKASLQYDIATQISELRTLKDDVATLPVEIKQGVTVLHHLLQGVLDDRKKVNLATSQLSNLMSNLGKIETLHHRIEQVRVDISNLLTSWRPQDHLVLQMDKILEQKFSMFAKKYNEILFERFSKEFQKTEKVVEKVEKNNARLLSEVRELHSIQADKNKEMSLKMRDKSQRIYEEYENMIGRLNESVNTVKAKIKKTSEKWGREFDPHKKFYFWNFIGGVTFTLITAAAGYTAYYYFTQNF